MCITFGALCLGVVIVIWFGRSFPRLLTAAVLAFISICLLGSVIVEAKADSGKQSGVIMAQEVIAHQADWQNSPPSFKEPLHEGTEFDLIESRTGWLHILLSDGSDGWIPQNSAELI